MRKKLHIFRLLFIKLKKNVFFKWIFFNRRIYLIFMPALPSFPILILFFRYITNLSFTLIQSTSAHFTLFEGFHAEVL